MICSTRVFWVLAVGLDSAPVTTGCGHDETGTPTATGASVATSPNDDAITRITTARCDREVACNNVGDGKKYADKGACEREVRQDTNSSLRASECGVVKGPEMDSCLSEITGQKCGDPFDAVSRMAACRQGKLCTK